MDDVLRELESVKAPVGGEVSVVLGVALFCADGDTFEVTVSLVVPSLTVGLTVVVREDVEVVIADREAVDERVEEGVADVDPEFDAFDVEERLIFARVDGRALIDIVCEVTDVGVIEVVAVVVLE